MSKHENNSDYTEPEVKDRKGDLSKDWYIEFWFKNPNTGKKKRFQRKGGANYVHNAKGRLKFLGELRNNYSVMLASGWTPFEKFEPKIEPEKPESESKLVIQAIQEVLAYRKSYLKDEPYRNIELKYRVFSDWLIRHGHAESKLEDVNRATVLRFLDYIKKERANSNRTRNNYSSSLHAMFQTLVDRELIEVNPVKGIKKLPSRSERNKRFTPERVVEISDYLKEHDPYLLLFIRFCMYTFLRPATACSLKVSHIDTERWMIHYIRAYALKEGVPKTKIIVKSLQPILVNSGILSAPGDHYLFPANKDGVQSATHAPTTRAFGARFRRMKQKLKLDRMETMYGFRHTAAHDLYFSFLKSGLTRDQALGKLQVITGHASQEAMMNYLRDIGAIIPEDYSDDITLKF